MDDPEALSISRRYQRKIAEELKAKQAEVEDKKYAEAEERRRYDLRTLSGLELTTNTHSSTKTETISRPTQSKNVKDRSNLPELDTRDMASLSMAPKPLPSPPFSDINHVPPSKPESRYTRPRNESELISQLQTELCSQQNHIDRLKEDLESTKHEVKRLRSERARVELAHLEAIQHNDKEAVANLEEQVSRLVRLVESTRKRERELEDEVDEGRSRERNLRQQLEEMRREKVGLMDEIQILKSPRSLVESPRILEPPPSYESRPKSRRASSSRGESRPERKKYEFSVRKGERRSSATLFTSVVSSFA